MRKRMILSNIAISFAAIAMVISSILLFISYENYSSLADALSESAYVETIDETVVP